MSNLDHRIANNRLESIERTLKNHNETFRYDQITLACCFLFAILAFFLAFTAHKRLKYHNDKYHKPNSIEQKSDSISNEHTAQTAMMPVALTGKEVRYE